MGIPKKLMVLGAERVQSFGVFGKQVLYDGFSRQYII
jgi:hypothetical protein